MLVNGNCSVPSKKHPSTHTNRKINSTKKRLLERPMVKEAKQQGHIYQRTHGLPYDQNKPETGSHVDAADHERVAVDKGVPIGTNESARPLSPAMHK
jgi:hypothetical protein